MYEFNMAEVLAEAAKLKPKVQEGADSFTKKLIKILAADNLPQDAWDTLSDDAQVWVNNQIRLTNHNKKVELVPGYDEYYAKVTETRDFAPNRSVVNFPNGKDAKEPILHDTISDVTADEPTPTKPVSNVIGLPPRQAYGFQKKQGPTATNRIKELLLEDMRLTPIQLLHKIESEGLKSTKNTATSMKAELKSTLALLFAKGWLVKNPLVD